MPWRFPKDTNAVKIVSPRRSIDVPTAFVGRLVVLQWLADKNMMTQVHSLGKVFLTRSITPVRLNNINLLCRILAQQPNVRRQNLVADLYFCFDEEWVLKFSLRRNTTGPDPFGTRFAAGSDSEMPVGDISVSGRPSRQSRSGPRIDEPLLPSFLENRRLVERFRFVGKTIRDIKSLPNCPNRRFDGNINAVPVLTQCL